MAHKIYRYKQININIYTHIWDQPLETMNEWRIDYHTPHHLIGKKKSGMNSGQILALTNVS